MSDNTTYQVVQSISILKDEEMVNCFVQCVWILPITSRECEKDPRSDITRVYAKRLIRIQDRVQHDHDDEMSYHLVKIRNIFGIQKLGNYLHVYATDTFRRALQQLKSGRSITGKTLQEKICHTSFNTTKPDNTAANIAMHLNQQPLQKLSSKQKNWYVHNQQTLTSNRTSRSCFRVGHLFNCDLRCPSGTEKYPLVLGKTLSNV